MTIVRTERVFEKNGIQASHDISSRMGVASSVKQTTTFLWWSQKCKQLHTSSTDVSPADVAIPLSVSAPDAEGQSHFGYCRFSCSKPLVCLNDRFFNGMSRLRQVLKRPCGPSMEMTAGSTAAVAFEPAGPSSPRPTPPNPGQLVQVLMHEREDRDVYGSHVCGSGSREVNDPPWGQFRRSLVGGGAPRDSAAGRENTSLASRAECTLGASTPGARSIPTLAQPKEISTFKGRT